MIYFPDDIGGCKSIKKCQNKKNHCLECNDFENLCQKCENSYYPDKIGGCSQSQKCEISYNGNCLKCIDNLF